VAETARDSALKLIVWKDIKSASLLDVFLGMALNGMVPYLPPLPYTKVLSSKQKTMFRLVWSYITQEKCRNNTPNTSHIRIIVFLGKLNSCLNSIHCKVQTLSSEATFIN